MWVISNDAIFFVASSHSQISTPLYEILVYADLLCMYLFYSHKFT